MADQSIQNANDIAIDVMAANERMGAALAFIYREAPEWKQRVADYLADYPFEWQRLNDGKACGNV